MIYANPNHIVILVQSHNAIITAKVQGGREVRGVVRSFLVSINLFLLIRDGCVYDCQFTETKPIKPQPC